MLQWTISNQYFLAWFWNNWQRTKIEQSTVVFLEKKQLWLRMAGKFMTTYFFAYDLSNQLWLHMAGKFMTTYIFAYDFRNQLWLHIAVYLNYLSSIYVLISSFVSLMKYAGRKLKTLMWLSMAGTFMSTYFLRTVIWLMSHILTADNRPEFL